MESSTALETALAAWLAFMNQLGVDMEPHLLPPATEVQIIKVESKLGYRLPEDLRQLYLIANGQTGFPYSEDPKDCERETGIWAPLFGNYEFLTLDEAIDAWGFNVEIANDIGNEIELEVRAGDPVDPRGMNSSWFVFAGRDANNYSVDMQPPSPGNPGQVVLHGADEWELQVVAQSVTELMQQAAQELDPGDESRFQYSDDDHNCQPTLFFDMDWRKSILSEQDMLQEQISFENQQQDWRERHPIFIQWMQKQETLKEQRNEDYRTWLQAQGYTGEQLSTMTSPGESMGMGFFAGPLNNGTTIAFIPDNILAELQAGEAEELDNLYMMQTMALGYIPEVEDTERANLVKAIETRYLYTFLSMYAERYSGYNHPGALPVKKKIQLISQFHLEQGMIPQEMYNGINELIIKLGTLPEPDELADTYQFESLGIRNEQIEGEAIVEFCFTDDCYDIPLQPYLTH